MRTLMVSQGNWERTSLGLADLSWRERQQRIAEICGQAAAAANNDDRPSGAR